jgi:hypothetical protein
VVICKIDIVNTRRQIGNDRDGRGRGLDFDGFLSFIELCADGL